MIARAWNNGHDNFGLKLNKNDRDKFFQEDWKSVTLVLDGFETVEVKITPSFWRKCSELRNKQIALWFKKLNCTNWPKRKPPQFSIEPNAPKSFIVKPEN